MTGALLDRDEWHARDSAAGALIRSVPRFSSLLLGDGRRTTIQRCRTSYGERLVLKQILKTRHEQLVSLHWKCGTAGIGCTLCFPMFLRCFDQNGLSHSCNGLSKNSSTSLHNHHQNTLKPPFTTIAVYRWNSCSLSKCLCAQQGQTLKKLRFQLGYLRL